MGRPKGSKNKSSEQLTQTASTSSTSTEPELAWGAKVSQDYQIATYDNKSITYRGEIKGFDYDKILRDKQKYIYDLFALSDYFVDKDQIYRGIVKNVYVPFSLSSGWKLTGSNEKTKTKYYEHYKSIGFGDIARSIFLQFYKYENVYTYLKTDGSLITLPVHKIRVSDVCANGESVLEFNIKELNKRTFNIGKTKKDFLDDLLKKYDGYPDEVKEAIKSGDSDWVQLDPDRTFCLTGLKEDWVKYGVPMVSACLEPFSKKALISNYENAQLSLGMRGFLHVMVGDKDSNIKIDKNILDANVEVFKSALSGFPLAVTNYMVQSAWRSIDTKQLFEKDMYRSVNSDILAAGGISAVVVAGDSSGNTSFASSQVSVQTAASRIKQCTDNFAEMMNKINIKLAGILGVTATKIPEFKFNEIDLTKDGKFRETCFKLWQQGVLSTRSLHEEFSIDHDQELERKKKENEDGYTEIFTLPPSFNNQSGNPDDSKSGAPTLPDDKRTSDPSKSASGKAPKPSTK